jgi:hypothetical protein
MAFRDAHENLADLDVRELDFLAGIIDRRIERLLELQGDEHDGDPEPELTLAA